MTLEFTAAIEGLTINPTHGASAQTGVALTVVTKFFSSDKPESVAYQWTTVESGDIRGATEETYTPDATLHDGETLSCRIAPAGYQVRRTRGYIIRHAEPVSVGTLWDEIVDIGSGPVLFDTAHTLNGEALIFSVVGPGASIDAATGRLSIQTDIPVTGAAVSVTAQNSGGTAQSVFQLTVECPGAGPGPDLSLPVLDAAANAIELTVDTSCTIYWRRDPTGTKVDAHQVIAGGGLDSGSFVVSAAATEASITFATGNDGWQEISFAAAVTASEPSLVQTVPIEIDTTVPAMLTIAL